jgi:hypothetical protein
MTAAHKAVYDANTWSSGASIVNASERGVEHGSFSIFSLLVSCMRHASTRISF